MKLRDINLPDHTRDAIEVAAAILERLVREQLLQVGASAECVAACAAQHHDARIRGALDREQRGFEFVERIAIERVALLRAVDRERVNAAGVRVDADVRHGRYA